MNFNLARIRECGSNREGRFHLGLESVVGVETQVIVEALLIAAMAMLHLAVMPWRFRTEELVMNAIFSTEVIKDVNTLGVLSVAKLTFVICLDSLRFIAEIKDSAFDKVYRRVIASFLVRIDETFTVFLLQHRILKKTTHRLFRNNVLEAYTLHPDAT